MTETSIFKHNERTLGQLKEAIDVAVVERALDEEHHHLWVQACERFHSSFNQLAFPGGLEQELESLRRGEQQAIEMAVRFLEADPWFFRSGYIKEELLRMLRRVELSEQQQERLRAVVLDRIRSGSGREFRQYCRLARHLVNPEFCELVSRVVDSSNAGISRRATMVKRAIES